MAESPTLIAGDCLALETDDARVPRPEEPEEKLEVLEAEAEAEAAPAPAPEPRLNLGPGCL